MKPRPEPAYEGYFADPFLTRFGDSYYVYGTGDPGDNSGGTFEVLESKNLVEWMPRGRALEPLDAYLGTDYWAPEVVEADGAFWMYFSVGHGIEGHHIRVARSENPVGPFVDQGVTLTPGESFAIDAHPFKGDDGTWYLFFARDVLDADRPGTHLAVVPLATMTSVGDTITPVLSPDSDWQIYARDRLMYGRVIDWSTLEGPTVVHHDDRYHLFFSGGSWETAGYGVSVASAEHPLGPWRHEPEENASLLSSELTGLVGPGHNSVLLGSRSDDVIAFHAWNPERTKRQMYVEPLLWVDGVPSV